MSLCCTLTVMGACGLQGGEERPRVATGGTGGTGGRSETSTGGRDSIVDVDISAPWSPEDPPWKTCDGSGMGGMGGGAPLQRAGCPVDPPTAGDCDVEGLPCLYEADEDGCFERWECVFGLWSTAGAVCESTSFEPAHDADEACPGAVPVPDSPCGREGLECGYDRCIGGSSMPAKCVCGRWAIGDSQCITVP